MVLAQTNDVIRKTTQLSFPQVKRVGNPSENKSRKHSGRTSRNDKLTNECGLTYDLLCEFYAPPLVKIYFQKPQVNSFRNFR
jgi:hypothetical protein